MLETLLSSAVMLGGVIWGIRLEGKVNGHQLLFAEREKQAEDHHAELIARLERIERKQDAANGQH